MLLVVLIADAGAASSPAYPAQPIRLVASGVGGAGDFTARIIAAGLTNFLGQQIIVDNRPGGLIPGEIVAKAHPDGYTLMLAGIVIWLSPFMRNDMPFDPARDFAPVTLAVTSPNVLVVYPGLPVTSVRELIALAKQKPGALNYATSGSGNSNHIAGELFNAMAGVKIMQVNYKGAGLALNDVVAGRVEIMFATATAATPHVSTGRLKALAVTSAKPTPLWPGLPTVASAGLPGYESGSTLGVFAPAATPAAIVNILNENIVKCLHVPENRELLFKSGIEAVGTSSAQFAAAIKNDLVRLGPVIRNAGIRID
jgi:tripartite-type tricarboxylate transporter receptor subunit TctC